MPYVIVVLVLYAGSKHEWITSAVTYTNEITDEIVQSVAAELVKENCSATKKFYATCIPSNTLNTFMRSVAGLN